MTARPRIVYTMTVEGVVYLMERVPIEDLPEWKREQRVRTVGSIGGQNTWPPAIQYAHTGFELNSD